MDSNDLDRRGHASLTPCPACRAIGISTLVDRISISVGCHCRTLYLLCRSRQASILSTRTVLAKSDG